MIPIFPTSYPRQAGTPAGSARTRRSRYGCRNCKLRKIKCDEAKPQCKKCISFGVICNYMSTNLPNLEPVTQSTRHSGDWTGTHTAISVRGPGPGQRLGPRRIPSHCLRPAISSAVWASNVSDVSGSYRFNLDARTQKLITRYFGENMVGSYEPDMASMCRALMKLSFSYPFLMHACIAGALCYDRYMEAISTPQYWSNGNGTPRRSLQECYHLCQATALLKEHFQELLSDSEGLAPAIWGNHDTRDPIWGTTSLLAMVTFSFSNSPRDASKPEESWPLVVALPSDPSSSLGSSSGTKPTSYQPQKAPHTSTITVKSPTQPVSPEPHTNTSTDTPQANDNNERPPSCSSEEEANWARVTNSKMALWDFVNPLRPESIFSVLKRMFVELAMPLPLSGIVGIPPDLAKLCGLSPLSTADSSPYFDAAHAVAHLWGGDAPMVANTEATNGDDQDSRAGATQIFFRVVSGRFEELLKARDPVALLLLYLWYVKARRGIWWIELRARVEVPAIHEYLTRYHGSNAELMAFLR
ncbi:hypothetical protein V8F20_009834 [Naviculisporaceae sp. PSN 640]